MNLRLGAAVAAVVLLVSCTQSTQGIFATVEREQKIKSAGGLSKVATVTHMASIPGTAGPPSTETQYFIAGGAALFHRSLSETKWHSLTISSGGKTYSQVMAVGSVVNGTSTVLYAVANLDTTDSDALFSSTDGINWGSPITIPTSSTGVQAFGLVPIVKSADGYSSDKLLLTTTESAGSSPGAYRRVYIIDGTGVTSTNGIDLGFDYSFPVTGAAVDGTSNYYFINNDSMFFSSNGTTATAVSLGGNGYYGLQLLPANTLQGFTNTTATQAVISTSKGYLYWGTVNSGAWSSVGSTSHITETSSGASIAFGSMILENVTSPQYVLIGTRNGVFYEGNGYASLSAVTGQAFAMNAPSGTDTDNYNSTDLPTCQVLTFFRAAADDNNSYYAGTAAHGLWKWTSGSWSQQ